MHSKFHTHKNTLIILQVYVHLHRNFVHLSTEHFGKFTDMFLFNIIIKSGPAKLCAL